MTSGKCFECESELTVVCLNCNPICEQTVPKTEETHGNIKQDFKERDFVAVWTYNRCRFTANKEDFWRTLLELGLRMPDEIYIDGEEEVDSFTLIHDNNGMKVRVWFVGKGRRNQILTRHQIGVFHKHSHSK